MAVKNTNLGGTNFTTPTARIKPTDLNDTFDATIPKFYGDNTGGSHSGDTTETDLATITVLQNDLTDNSTLVINSGIYAVSANTTELIATFRLYVGGVVVKTVAFTLETGNSGDDIGNGTNLCFLSTGVDTTAGNVIVKVTGQLSSAIGSIYCNGLNVVGYRG